MKIEIVLGIQGGTEIEEIAGTAIVNEREIGIGTVENTSKSSPLYPNLGRFWEGANGVATIEDVIGTDQDHPPSVEFCN